MGRPRRPGRCTVNVLPCLQDGFRRRTGRGGHVHEIVSVSEVAAAYARRASRDAGALPAPRLKARRERTAAVATCEWSPPVPQAPEPTVRAQGA